MAAAVFAARSSPSIGCSQKCEKASPHNVSGCRPCCGKTSFSSDPAFAMSGAPAFGLTQSQSRPGGGARVPLVSTAISKPLAWTAQISAASSCNKGSPPVNTINRSVLPPIQAPSIAVARASAPAKLPPPVPSNPTKSVSQKRQTARPRSFSWPDQRLQPEKRQNTAARPAFAPSPCNVRKISFTAYLLMRVPTLPTHYRRVEVYPPRRSLGHVASKKDLARGPLFLTRRGCNGQIASLIHFFNSLFGAAPTFEEAILPSLNSMSVGMLRMP